MVVHYPRERLRYNSEQPAAICDVLLASGPGSYRSGDIPLGTPTTSARTRRGLWALYPVGEEVVVAYQGGALAGPPAEVAATLDRLVALDGRDPLERQVVQALRGFLVGDQTRTRPSARRWSRPAVGYWLSGPRNQPGRGDRRAGPELARRPLAESGDDHVRPARPKVAPEPARQPAA
jgi:hypothetical protein